MRAQRAGRRVLSRGPATAARVTSPRASESKFGLSRRPRRESSLRARQASTHRLLCARSPKPSSRPAAATQDLVTPPAPLIRCFEAGGSFPAPGSSLTRSSTISTSQGGREHFWQPCGRRRKNDGVRVSPTHPLFARAWPCNMWHPSAHWETSRIAAKFIGPRAARYGRSRPLLTLAPFTALRTRVRVKKKQ